MICEGTRLFDDVHRKVLMAKINKVLISSKGKTIEEVFNSVIEMLNNWESLSFGQGNSGTKYAASIASLREAILATAIPLINKRMSVDDGAKFKRFMEDDFFSKAGINNDKVVENTEPEGPSMENNPEMPNEDERNKQKLSQITEDYYGTVIKANKFREKQFGLDLIKVAIIDTENRTIIRSSEDLNQAICSLKNKYLNNIVQYLQHIDPNFKVDGRMFGDNLKLLPGYLQILNRFYNELKKIKKSGNLESRITEGWKKRLVGQNDLLYDALNSYVNIVYFDNMLEDAIGKVVVPTEGFYGVELDGSFQKYQFSKGDEHKRKSFQNSENRDALGDIAKFSKLVLSTIPIYSSLDGKFLNRYVTTGIFANAITSLFTRATQLDSKVLQEAIYNFHENPRYYSGIIFEQIAKNPKLQKNLERIGINRFNINVLTSVYEYVYNEDNPNSIKSIETDSLLRQFAVDGYFIIDSINGVIDRTMEAAYIQMVYSGTSGMVETTQKKKYATRRSSFNIINKINEQNFSKPIDIRQRLADKYKVSQMNSSNSRYSVTIGNYKIIANSPSDQGILDRSSPITFEFTNPKLKEILNPSQSIIDLISSQTVDRIISNFDLSEEEQLFRDTLEFIDTFLGTRFLNIDGLNKLFLYIQTKSNTENYLEELLASAVRTAVVNDLYNQFNKALKNKTYTSFLSFESFLKDTYAPFGSIDFKKIEESKPYVQNQSGMMQLLSVGVTDSWIDDLSTVEDIISGEVSKSTTNDINNNKIANNRTSFLGGNLQYYLSKYKAAGKVNATSPLLFTTHNNLIVKPVFNTDAESRLGIKKSVKDMKAAELFYSSIIFNFYGSYMQSSFNAQRLGKAKNELYNTILTQPTTFSDKISFVMYAIRGDKPLREEGKSYDGKTIWQLNTEEVIDLYQDTIGAAYINLYKNVLSDLRVLLDMPDATVDQINETLKNTVIMDVVDDGVVVEEGLITKAQRMGIELQLDTHYRAVKGTKIINGKKYKVTYGKFNELLHHYATDLYVNRDTLVKRFNTEKVNFVNDLLSSGVVFYTNYYDDSDDVLRNNESSNPISKIIDNFYKLPDGKPDTTRTDNYRREWVKNNKLVIAKVNGVNIMNQASIPEGSDVVLNPILEKYFYTDSLLANNLRFELTGSEVAHPDKAKINYTEELKKLSIVPELNPEYFQQEVDEKTGEVRYEAIDNFKDLVWLKHEALLNPILQPIYNTAILKTEAVAQGTQLKRNVIIPATLQYEQMGTLNGIPSKMKVAVIKDTQAKIFNFRGDYTTEDAHDGSAYINPFVSILENGALQDQEVGVDKKPIWHSFNPRLMSATLLKFATFTITNERMKTSLNADVNLYKLFKQMTNQQWSEDVVNENGEVIGKKWNNSRGIEFDLTKTKGHKRNQYSTITNNDRKEVFFNNILGGKPLYYKEDNIHYQILNFGRDEYGYFTEELPVNILGGPLREDSVKVYHRFDSNSEHRKFSRDTIPTNESGLHDINSLFELFNVLGGIYSESLVGEEGEETLKASEASSYAVVSFMNNVSVKIGNDSRDISQRTYYQPLKEMMIAYAANQSAVKNGTANVNSEEAWKGDTKLSYMELDTDGLGIQMDADHEIDEAEMTEFSQVISALEAGGRLHLEAKQVYRTLGQLAIKASQIEIQTVIDYIKAKNAGLSTSRISSELYDILGRTLINNYKQKEDRIDLAAPMIAEIKKKFNLNVNDHSLDELKIPFSDSNLYSQTISTFVSNINGKSIKRKYPGSGCVMVPGYGIIQTYKYNGKVMMFDDVLEEARREIITDEKKGKKAFFRTFDPQVESIASYNRSLVQAYLGIIQEREWKNATTSVGQFIPTDIVDVLADGHYITTINLNDPIEYYAFKGFTKEDPDGKFAELNRQLLIQRKSGVDISQLKNLSFSINVTRPRDLAPARIQWQYEAPKEENDAILGRATDNEFGSDVAVILKNPQENVHFLGTSKDFENFKVWKQLNPNPSTINDSDPILNQVRLVLKRNPEFFNKIQSIGATIEDYASYVRNIFPNSKEKDIYWHGSNSDFSEGFDSAVRGVGSGAPEVENEFYLAKQPYSVLQYVNGVNRNFPVDKNGFSHWNKLYWELKEIMSNGRRENNKWKYLVIGPEEVRQKIPNKKGIFNRDSGGNNGKYLSERKADYGYENKSDEEFFRDVFGIEYGKDTFNTWIEKNRAIFKTLEDTQSGIYPAVINVTNPIIEIGKNTYYEEERGLKTLAKSKTHLVTTNIFDTAPVRDSFLRKVDTKENRQKIQAIFDELDGGYYLGQRIFNLKNEAAELVISNMYASKFDTKGQSLASIMGKGPNAFRIGSVKPIVSSHYELAFTTNNGKHTYITFKAPKQDEHDMFTPKNVGWKYTKNLKDSSGRLSKYVTTQDGQILYKVGQYIPKTNVSYVNEQYVDSNDTSKIIEDPNLYTINGQVFEYVEFISNWQVVQKGKNGRPITYNLYSINASNIGKAQSNPTENSVNTQIVSILNKLYKSENYNGIRMNYIMSGSSALRISNILPKLDVQDSLKKFIGLNIDKYLKNIDPNKTFIIDSKSYNSDLKDYYNNLSKEIFTSFEKSLTFTASRIPAQTLQSFMQMKAVGFTQSSKNIAYVSHWQTW